MTTRLIRKASTHKSTGFDFGKIKVFLKSNWFILAIVCLGLPYLYRYYKAQFQLNTEQDLSLEKSQNWLANLNPTIQQTKAIKITNNIEVQVAAKKLAHDLGTKYSDTNSMWSWINPKGWTENDTQVLNTLLKYRNFYPQLQRLYHDCYTNSRNLSDDVLNLLDEAELKRLRQAIKI
jgi:hypothetical protein